MSALLIDIGNSRLKWRCVDRDGPCIDGVVPIEAIDRLADDWRRIDEAPDQVVISNVARAHIESIVVDAIVARWTALPMHRVTPGRSACGVVNGYRAPSLLGPDRWAGLIGAHGRWPGRSLLVCSFGTATTIDLLVDRRDDTGVATFVGGLILPGLTTMQDALATSTARLPRGTGSIVDFGASTDDAISSGAMTAQVGAVEHAWHAAKRRVVASDPLRLVVAGGAAPIVLPFLGELRDHCERLDDLVLRGLERIASDRTSRAADAEPVATTD